MGPIDPIEFGRLAARLDATDQRMQRVEAVIEKVDSKLDVALTALAEKRGERRAAGYIAGLTATVVSLAMAVLERIANR